MHRSILSVVPLLLLTLLVWLASLGAVHADAGKPLDYLVAMNKAFSELTDYGINVVVEVQYMTPTYPVTRFTIKNRKKMGRSILEFPGMTLYADGNIKLMVFHGSSTMQITRGESSESHGVAYLLDEIKQWLSRETVTGTRLNIEESLVHLELFDTALSNGRVDLWMDSRSHLLHRVLFEQTTNDGSGQELQQQIDIRYEWLEPDEVSRIRLERSDYVILESGQFRPAEKFSGYRLLGAGNVATRDK